MSLKKVHLRKLLQLFYMQKSELIGELRKDIRQDIIKESGQKSSGGDFYGPFWTDAKNHASGKADLSKQTIIRVRGNDRRARLFPKLEAAFLEWWDEKRRWRNEPFEVINVERIKGNYEFLELGAIVKVENLFCVQVGDGHKRLIYPYFSEAPELSNEGFRLGLWLMSEALASYGPDDNRILDVLRSKSGGWADYPLNGDERKIFLENYIRVSDKWNELRKEY